MRAVKALREGVPGRLSLVVAKRMVDALAEGWELDGTVGVVSRVLSLPVLIVAAGCAILLSAGWTGERLLAGVIVVVFAGVFAVAVEVSVRGRH